MRLKFLCLLWSVLGHFGLASDDTDTKEIVDASDATDTKKIVANAEVLTKLLSKNLPEHDKILAIRNWLFELKGCMTYMKKNKDVSLIKYLKEMGKERDTYRDAFNNVETRYGNIVRAVKTRDWIVDLERIHFPAWLNYVDAGRYLKWSIALYSVNSDYFNKLRNDLENRTIGFQNFAAEIDNMYEKSSISLHDNYDIEKPKNIEDVKEFCKFLAKQQTPASIFACEVVAKDSSSKTESTDSVGKVTPESKILSTTTPSYPTKFYIIIAGADPKGDSKLLLNQIESDIENVQEFNTKQGVIIQSNPIPGNPYKSDTYDKRTKKHLPGFFLSLEVQVEFNIGSRQQKLDELEKYKSLKEAIIKKLKLRDPLKPANIQIVDDDYFSYAPLQFGTTSTLSLPLKDSVTEKSTNFFVCISKVVQSEGKNLENEFIDVKKKIDEIIKGSAIKYLVIESTLFNGNDDFRLPNKNSPKFTMPGMYIHVRIELDLSDKANPNYKSNLIKYDQLKVEIINQLQLRDQLKIADIQIVDDDNFSPNLPMLDSVTKKLIVSTMSTYPTKFFVVISKFVQSEENDLIMMFNKVQRKIEQIIQDFEIKYIMIESKPLTKNDDLNTLNKIFQTSTVPGMFFHVGIELDMSDKTSPNYNSIVTKYGLLKKEIKEKIQAKETDGKKEYELSITDDSNKITK